MRSKKIIFIILFLLLFTAFFVKAAPNQAGIDDKIKEFFSLFLDLLIKFFQLVQEFFGLIIKFLLWLKEKLT